MKRTALTIFLSTGIAAMFSPAFAEDPQRVAWAPSYSGSCEDCQLAGRQLPNWDFKDANYPRANFSGSMLHGAQAERANFSSIIGPGVNFSQANLSGADFSNATLTGANLIGANCSTGILTEANLAGADISGARFIAADLSDLIATNLFGPSSDFSGAVATKANFTDAVLTDAVFDGAILFGAIFSGADISGASFRDTQLSGSDLSGVIGFESADFSGACTSSGTRLPSGLDVPLCEDLLLPTKE